MQTPRVDGERAGTPIQLTLDLNEIEYVGPSPPSSPSSVCAPSVEPDAAPSMLPPHVSLLAFGVVVTPQDFPLPRGISRGDDAAVDYVVIENWSRLLQTVTLISSIATVVSVLSLIITFDLDALTGGLVALTLALASSFLCHRTTAEFDWHHRPSFRVKRRRMLLRLCDQETIICDVPAALLGTPTIAVTRCHFYGSASIVIPIRGPTTPLRLSGYHNDAAELQGEEVLWKAYVNKFCDRHPDVASVPHSAVSE